MKENLIIATQSDSITDDFIDYIVDSNDKSIVIDAQGITAENLAILIKSRSDTHFVVFNMHLIVFDDIGNNDMYVDIKKAKSYGKLIKFMLASTNRFLIFTNFYSGPNGERYIRFGMPANHGIKIKYLTTN